MNTVSHEQPFTVKITANQSFVVHEAPSNLRFSEGHCGVFRSRAALARPDLTARIRVVSAAFGKSVEPVRHRVRLGATQGKRVAGKAWTSCAATLPCARLRPSLFGRGHIRSAGQGKRRPQSRLLCFCALDRRRGFSCSSPGKMSGQSSCPLYLKNKKARHDPRKPDAAHLQQRPHDLL